MKNKKLNKKERKRSAFLQFYKECVVERTKKITADDCSCVKFYEIFRYWCNTYLKNKDLYAIECRNCVKRLLQFIGKGCIIKTNGGYSYYKDITLKDELLEEYNKFIQEQNDTSSSIPSKPNEMVVAYINSNDYYLDCDKEQIEAINRYCEKKHYQLNKIYSDITKKMFIDTDYKKLIDAVCKKLVSKIIVYDFQVLATVNNCSNGLNHFLAILSSNDCKIELVDPYIDVLDESTDWLKKYTNYSEVD